LGEVEGGNCRSAAPAEHIFYINIMGLKKIFCLNYRLRFSHGSPIVRPSGDPTTPPYAPVKQL
jgi:hypothetical protein